MVKKNDFVIPSNLLPYFRSNHAGETGAVFIYKGIMAVSNDPKILKFSQKHLITETNHLNIIEQVLDKQHISKLIFFWKLAGFFTGFIPALLGKNFVYATIYYVESFVEKHYQEQLSLLSKDRKLNKIRSMISELMADEISHKKESLSSVTNLNPIHRVWGKVVTIGSKLAVNISKKFSKIVVKLTLPLRLL